MKTQKYQLICDIELSYDPKVKGGKKEARSLMLSHLSEFFPFNGGDYSGTYHYKSRKKQLVIIK